jgi:ABC-type dipeptide/oligopeptide/nickel transport system ATPase component
MGIAFGKIRWKNLLSTGNAFTELDLSTQGTTLIVGENGAGKCVRKNTTVDITFADEETKEKYMRFVNSK